MTAPLNQSLTIQRGDDVTLTITFSQPISAFDEIWFTVREAWATVEANDGDAAFSGSLTGGEITGTGTHTAVVLLPNADTVALAYASYVYDVQVRAAGKLYTTQRGQLRLDPDVTRSS